jgi:hypothetical protein
MLLEQFILIVFFIYEATASVASMEATPDSRTVKMVIVLNSPIRNAIAHEVKIAVSNTKRD